MILIEKVNLQNVVTYKDQTFNFEPGLTLVRGENRAGKSLLFSSLANLLYYSHPLADKKDPKAILSASGEDELTTAATKKASEASITLQIKKAVEANLYSIKQKSVKDSITYQIQENGIELDSRTIALSKTVIESIYNQPEDIFFTSTYLTSYRNHPLLHGSTAQRYEFFEKLFNFELFDYLHDSFSKELKTLNDKKIELENLKSLVLDLPLKEQTLETTVSDLQQLKARRGEIQSHLSIYTQLRIELIRLLDSQNDSNQRKQNVKNLQQTHVDLLNSFTLYDLSTQLQLIEVTIQDKERIYQQLLDAEKHKAYLNSLQADVNQKEAMLTQVNTKLEEFNTKVDASLLNLSATELQQELTKLNTTIIERQAALQNKPLELWQREFSTIEEKKQTIARSLNLSLEALNHLMSNQEYTVTQEIQKQQSDLITAKHKLTEVDTKSKQINSLKASCSHTVASSDVVKCPTCFSELNAEQLNQYLLDLTTEKASLQSQIQEASNKYANYNSLQDCITFMSRAPSLDMITEATTIINQARLQLPIIQELIKVKVTHTTAESNYNASIRELETFKATIQDQGTKQSINVEQNSSVIRRDIDLLKDYSKLLEQEQHAEVKVINKLADLDKLITAETTLHFLQGKIQRETVDTVVPQIKIALENKISKLTNENTNMQTAITDNSVREAILTKEIQALKQHVTKIELLLDQCTKINLLERLVKVFHPKGFRLEKIKYFTKVVESALNKFAGFLFMEPFTFNIVVEKRDLQILATRSNKTSDVRYLSGSESRCFQLLCLISILSLLPSAKRTNVCILDEMDAGCDEGTTKMFYESFLPELRNIVPSVVVITPLQDHGYYINEDRSYLIKKVAGESTINLVTKSN